MTRHESPGDLQYHEGDEEAHNRVGQVEPEGNTDRAQDDAQRNEAVCARMIAVCD